MTLTKLSLFAYYWPNKSIASDEILFLQVYNTKV